MVDEIESPAATMDIPAGDIRDAQPPGVVAFDACPFLVSADGAWRGRMPSRDHRCTAVAPAAALATDKQRRLCLTSGHASCSTYGAAVAARTARDPAGRGPTAARWGYPRTTPVVDVGTGVGSLLRDVAGDRRAWQIVPVIVLVIVVGAVAAAGFGPGAAPSSSASANASHVAVVSPTASPPASATPVPSPSSTPAPTATAEPTDTPAPTATPSAEPTPTPAPSASGTYTVKSNDTLWAIAQSHGTSVSAIMKLNNLTSTTLHVGQVLLLP